MRATTAGCGSSVGINFGKEYYNMIVNAGYRGKVGVKAPKFTYTGKYNIRKDGVVELLTSGTIVFLEPKVIDVFMVGGGGAGGSDARNTVVGCGGGGGGYTRTVRKHSVTPNTSYNVIIGAGAEASRTVDKPVSGSTSFGNIAVAGGKSVQLNRSDSDYTVGADGGSGGGGGRYSKSTGGSGGSDGGDGEFGSQTSGIPAKGQGTTTREFGEPDGKLYAGGGGGGTYISAQSPVYALGGAGGGGAGAWGAAADRTQAAGAGGANTGGGGGGGVGVGGVANIIGGSGGSGVVCFRDAVELPELAGTWVLNEKLYAPETMPLTENVNFSSTNYAGGAASENNQCIFRTQYGVSYFEIHSTSLAKTVTVYTFNTDSWTNKWTHLTFPAGATASDAFRAWLANNATKQ